MQKACNIFSAYNVYRIECFNKEQFYLIFLSAR